MWTNMQKAAEEKNKGYRCLVYTTHPLTPSVLYSSIDMLTCQYCTDEAVCGQADSTCGMEVSQC